MNAIDVVLGIGALVDAWLVAYAFLRIRRTLAKFVFVALLLDLVVTTGAFVGVELGALGGAWAGVALWTFVLSHPLGAALVLAAIHGEGLFRRHPYVLLVFAPVPFLAAFAPPVGYRLADAYATAPLNWYLVLCLALPLGEAAAAWHRYPARKSELFLLLAGAVVLVLTGPVYGFELQGLGLAEGAGSNPGAPIAAGLFAAALTLANPLPMRRVPAGPGADPNFPAGRLLLVDEIRPKASAHYVGLAVYNGRPSLKIVRGSSGPPPVGHDALAVAALRPTASAVSVLLATASEFLARHPSGLVYVRDLSYIVALAGAESMREGLTSLQRIVTGTGGSVVTSLALLTPAERRDAMALPGVAAVRLPDPAVEFEAILTASVGGAATQLLKSFAAREHRRPEDLAYEDLPDLERFLGTALAELARAPGDDPVITGWRKTLDHVNLDLDRFARRSLPETAAGPWPSAVRATAGEDLLVRASDYWKGRELEEMLRVVTQPSVGERFAERVRAAFVQALGRTGEHIFESELRRIGKGPKDLSPDDMPRLAEGAAAAIASLGSAVDLPQGRADLEERGRRLRTMLAGIAEEVGHGA